MARFVRPLDGPLSIFVGFDAREAAAFAVTKESARRRLTQPIPIYGIERAQMERMGVYWRPTDYRMNDAGVMQLWDRISSHWMSTEFAISRFLTPFLARDGWALFMDCDMLVRTNLVRMFEELADPKCAVMVVKHDHRPDNTVKMDGQAQTQYDRKNWSSVCLWNVAHPSNRVLTPEFVNTLPGRDLHAFCWLKDHEIGELPLEWNWLVGISDPVEEPNIVHFTEGPPVMAGHENDPFADEWRFELSRWVF